MLLCIADDWDASRGQLQAYERQPGQAWSPWGRPVPVALGRQGLAWGRGLHPQVGGTRSKREGDGRAPAGIFKLGLCFADPERMGLPAGLDLPLRWATPDLFWVDDPDSAYYNCLVDGRETAPDWRSAESLLRADERYLLAAEIKHNTDPVEPGAGSCIFLHVWAGPGQGTAGCTAMALPELLRLLQWLKADASPCLVQLPGDTYADLRIPWGLAFLP